MLFLTENRFTDLTGSNKDINRASKTSGFHGNRFIVTSAPVLHPVNTSNTMKSPAVQSDVGIEEQIIQPQQATSQKAKLMKSTSLSQTVLGNSSFHIGNNYVSEDILFLVQIPLESALDWALWV